MKNTVFVLLFALCFLDCKKTEDRIYRAIRPQIGVVLQNDFTAANWGVTSPASTWTFSGKISVSGGADDLNNYAVFSSYYVALDNCVLTATITCKDANPSVTSDGIMLGFQAWNNNGSIGNDMIQLAPTQSAGAGKCICWTYDGQISGGSGAFPAPHQNDQVRLRVTKRANVTVFEAWNITNNTDYFTYTETHNLSYPLGPTSSLPQTRVGIWQVKGSFEVNAWSLTTTERKNVMSVFVGDSKTYGKGAVSVSNRYCANGTSAGLREVSANGGDETQQVLDRMAAILNYKPKYVVLWIGCNDVADGVPTATWQANMTTIKNTLASNGITLITLTCAPESRFSAEAVLNPWIRANMPNVVDVYPSLVGSGTALNSLYDCGDHVHLNATGLTVVYSLVKAAYPYAI